MVLDNLSFSVAQKGFLEGGCGTGADRDLACPGAEAGSRQADWEAGSGPADWEAGLWEAGSYQSINIWG